MSPHLDALLCERYPLLFKDRHSDPAASAMCWGFECGDGWFTLIDNLCKSLMWDGFNHENKYVREDPPTVVQVKEKYGTLRFYADGRNEKDAAIIGFAELLSGSICEKCGAMEGTTQTEGGWIRTLCPTHMEEYVHGSC